MAFLSYPAFSGLVFVIDEATVWRDRPLLREIYVVLLRKACGQDVVVLEDVYGLLGAKGLGVEANGVSLSAGLAPLA